MHIDYDKVEKIKKLGYGQFSTVYLVKYKERKYALKIHNILPRERKFSFNSEVWKELDVYGYINKLTANDYQFFVRLFDYKIYDNCKHKQFRHPSQRERFKELDKSDWCINILMEYKENVTPLKQLFTKLQPTVAQIYSIMTQVCNISLILNKGGYFHNDLHPENILYRMTGKETFKILDREVPFNGIQLTAIDYNLMLHKKFGDSFERKKKVYKQMKFIIEMIIARGSYYFETKNKSKKGVSNEFGENRLTMVIWNIYNKHKKFYDYSKKKYGSLFPNGLKPFNNVESNIGNGQSLVSMVGTRDKDDFWEIINRIYYEFLVTHPNEYAKYYGLIKPEKPVIPRDDVLEFLMCVTGEEIVAFCIKKLKYHSL